MRQLARAVALGTPSVEVVPHSHVGRDIQTQAVVLRSLFKEVFMEVFALQWKVLSSPFMREQSLLLLRSLNKNFHQI